MGLALIAALLFFLSVLPKKLEVVAPEENVSKVFDRLQNKDIPELLVMHGNNMVGLLRRKDVVRWLELQSQTS